MLKNEQKILIIGATGSVGSALSGLLKQDGIDAHLVAKNKDEVSKLSDKYGFSHTSTSVLDSDFLEKIHSDLNDVDIQGLAYCVGSIDLKPFNLVTKKDYLNCFDLNFFPVIDLIKKFQENLKKINLQLFFFLQLQLNKVFQIIVSYHQ